MDSRRTFIKKTVGILTAGWVVFKSQLAVAKKLAVPLDKLPALNKVGGWAKVKLSGKEILFIRDSNKSIKGVAPKCTHMDCALAYNPKTTHLDCACHGSSFDLNGKVLRGPATKNLKTYLTSLQDARIVVTVE